MQDITVELIGHKNSVHFFKCFFKEHTASQLGYQLQRMFEQGSAIFGDYFLVKANRKPFMMINGDRTNCKRIFSSDIHFNLSCSQEEIMENFESAINEVIQYILDDEVYNANQKTLEFEIYNLFPYHEQFKSALKKNGFTESSSTSEYELNLSSPDISNYLNKIKAKPTKKIIDYPVEERYRLFSEFDNHVCLQNKTIPISEIYKDYIEAGYKSETLWEVILNENNQISAVYLPVIENPAYKQVRLLKYFLVNNTLSKKDIIDTILKKCFDLCKVENYNELSLSADSEDDEFQKLIQKLNGVQNFTKTHFIRKDYK